MLDTRQTNAEVAHLECFASCPKGLEALLADELLALSAQSVRQTVAGVYASGSLELAYRACLWSRLANHIFLPLGKFPVETADQLYAAVASIDWSAHMTELDSLAVDFSGQSQQIRHTRFGAQRVKDAIVDHFWQRQKQRPEVDLHHPDLRIQAHLAKGSLVVSIDLSGRSLHRRGYRVAMVPAPLKENLAAAILVRAGWPEIRAQQGALIDPMCGSGTLLIEGAMMAADIAPGLLRARALAPSGESPTTAGPARPAGIYRQRPGAAFGFLNWKGHDEVLWQRLLNEAVERGQRGMAADWPEIRGYDKDSAAIAAAQQNISAAGLEGRVRVLAKPLRALKQPTHTAIAGGLLVCNPPYGERWGDVEELKPLYRELGDVARAEFPGWRLAVFTGNPDLGGELRLRSDRKYRLFNGTIASELLVFALHSEPQRSERAAAEGMAAEGAGVEKNAPRPAAPLSAAAAELANRLRKNSRRLQSWLKRSGVSCYRLYDRDMPEFAVAIDVYQPAGDEQGAICEPPALHVQEYAAPATVDERAAREHLEQVREALFSLFPDSRARIYFKERRRQKGDSQYRRLSSPRPSSGTGTARHSFTVAEGPALFEVNLADYLDTGLFLDHRPVRQLLAELAAGRRFLNLFCYTATATVQVALAGALSSLSVDMSNTYLQWARRNFDLNSLDHKRHCLLRADCLAWLAQEQGSYDLILLDPPTFSNSANTENVLDIQRDHGRLVRQAMALLAPGGTLVFSNNYRRFRLDGDLAEDFQVEDITAASIPEDFARNGRIHHCWLMRHRSVR